MNNLGYSKKHDSYYDLNTFEWIDLICSDWDCGYCKNRPETAKDESKNS